MAAIGAHYLTRRRPELVGYLTGKRRKLPDYPANHVCPLDGKLTGKHPRCLGCRFLVGPRHEVKRLQRGYCDSCRATRERKAHAVA
jgi:hypothetical protein